MAIIVDRKLDEEAERQAREYAQRNDTSALDWQHPPPAYEEAPSGSSSSNTRPPPSHPSQVTEQAEGSQQGLRVPERASDEVLDDESIPLLPGRRVNGKRLKARIRIKKVLFLFAVLLVNALVVLLILKLTGNSGKREMHLPNPPESDGTAIQDPIWSTPTVTKRELWPNPKVPLYSSTTNFTFSAFNEFFFHARDGGANFNGHISVINIANLSDKEVIQLTGGTLFDQVYVQIQSQFTDILLRDRIRVSKMKINNQREGLGIYGQRMPQDSRDGPFLAFYASVFIPSGWRRSSAGLAKDLSSFLPELDISVDTMRISVEGMQIPVFDTSHATLKEDSVTVGRLQCNQGNGDFGLIGGFKANESISLTTKNGPVRDLPWTFPASLLAPRISIALANGHIWFNKLVATESIHLQSINGGIKITDVAMAKSIKIRNEAGVLGGKFRANDLDFSTVSGDVAVEVDLVEDIFEGEESIEGESRQTSMTKCLHKKVAIENKNGDVSVQFKNHREGVLLNSNITSIAGKIVVEHDFGFEGRFEARNQIGQIDINQRYDSHARKGSAQDESMTPETETASTLTLPGKKEFLIEKWNRGPIGRKEVAGRTWFSNHSWEEKHAYCQSKSIAKNEVGSILMTF